MARLTEEQWRSVRAMWEASANRGLAWMTKAGNGPWDVTAEAVRRRKNAEGWRKHAPVPGGADAVVGCCGGKSAREGARAGLFAPADGWAGLDPAGDLDELRDALLVQHRRDWLAYRGLLSAAAAEGRDGGARGVKTLGEAVRTMQIAEREAFGMDPAQHDFGAMTLEQLEALAAGRWPRKPR
jgi:hypothetical protein